MDQLAMEAEAAPEGEAAADDPVAQVAEALEVEYTIIKSPNCNERKYKDPATGEAQRPNVLVLSYTVGGKLSVEKTFKNAEKEKSAHYLVDREGNITRFVQETDRAFLTGLSKWQNQEDVNTFSIGIILENSGSEPYSQEQLKTLAALLKNICERWNIPLHNVVGLGDVAIPRHVAPGPHFPWEDFHKQYGIGAWYDLARTLRKVELPSEETKVTWVQTHLEKYGYTCPQTGKLDEGTTSAVKAFQMHFRATDISGEIDGETIAILAQLVDVYIEQG